MENERIDAIKAIIGQLDSLSADVDGHLHAVQTECDEQDSEDLTQHLEFAFAELRAARRELQQATEFSLS